MTWRQTSAHPVLYVHMEEREERECNVIEINAEKKAQKKKEFAADFVVEIAQFLKSCRKLHI